MRIEQIHQACQEEYDKNYSTGEYCHEQSFKWGFQEGVDWADKHSKRYSQDELCDIQLEMMRQRDKRLIEKVCKYLETNFGIELCMAFGDKFIDKLRKAMENDK